MFVIGSPEWFNMEAKKRIDFQNKIELYRKEFLDEFSPIKLKSMSAEDLLEKVFGDSCFSMTRILMLSKKYFNFGSCDKYIYHSVLYITNGQWKYKNGKNAINISEVEAKRIACYLRDNIVECLSVIESLIPLNSVSDYIELSGKLSKIFLSNYAWVFKYYQMVYPQYFPGMYADNTVNRAMNILGLPNQSDKLVNMGVISLFIRKCDVNNIIFNDIFGKTWSWDKAVLPCQNAQENYKTYADIDINQHYSYYRLSNSISSSERAMKIEKEVSCLELNGEDREAIVKIRVNQDIFREMLLKKFGKCCLCGVSHDTLLVASHIKPWSVSENNEKLDINNGLLLCPNHDKLFDKGYISFDNDGKILISGELKQNDRLFMNVSPDMQVNLNAENKRYMIYHRENIFIK